MRVMPQGIKLVSVNIEMNRHLDAVLSFLEQERPDVVCLQELLERDMRRLEEALGFGSRFEPMAVLKSPLFAEELQGLPFGMAMFSRHPATYGVSHYAGTAPLLPDCIQGDEGNKLLLTGVFQIATTRYCVGTTHFTWTPDGEASNAQREDMSKLLAILSGFPDMVFCGDFNAPRGGEIWEKLAARYQDNIPAVYRSSLDPVLHRAGHLEHVVDGLFSTPEYRVSAVRLVEGVSDHKAVVGYVEWTG